MDLASRTRQDFPVLRRRIDDDLAITYLDSAATSLTPQAVIDDISEYYSTVSANVHRGHHRLSEEASDRFEEVRASAAQFLGCRATEIAFVANTTHALNIVAAGLQLGRDDLVLCPLDTHHSNLLPWRSMARVEFIELAEDGRVDLADFVSRLRRRPRVVALTHCSNVTGIVAPVKEMADMAKAAGALVVLDAAQSAPHRRLRLAELGVDFAAFSAHKMLGPTGVGVLYVSASASADQADRLKPSSLGGGTVLKPPSLGGGTVDWVDEQGQRLRRAPHRFEPGTPNIGGIYGFGAAISYLTKIGMDTVEAHDRSMAKALVDEVGRRPHLSALGPGAPLLERSGIVSFTIDDCPDAGKFSRILSDSYGIMCRSGHMCAQPVVQRLAGAPVLRLSAYIYNDSSDISRAFEAVDEVYESTRTKATRR